jgi:hypothetical protein
MDKADSRRDRSAYRGDSQSRREDTNEPDGLEDAEEKLQEICAQMEQDSGSQASLGLGGFDQPSGDGGGHHPDIQVQAEAYERYYEGYHNIILKYIPKSDLRYAILDLGKLYLKEGDPAKSDSRQARPSQLEEVSNTVVNWVMEHNGENPTKLFKLLYALNEQAGYEPERVL